MDLFAQLQLGELNAGTCDGYGRWLSNSTQPELLSINPSSGVAIGAIKLCSLENYNAVIENAQSCFKEWRQVPAPKRGELVRLMGQALREKKDALGSLVALEMGKSKEEGDGEVQEMIDMADFAVGQSRMLYGKTLHSERSGHRMYEQWI